MNSKFFLPLLSCLLLSACQSLPERPANTPAMVERQPRHAPSPMLAQTPRQQRDSFESPDDTRKDAIPTAPSAPADFWAQWRRETALPDCDAVPGAERWARWYAAKQKYMERVQQRAQPLLWTIHQQVRARGLPSEFTLLPVVESAYNPWAYSHGRAAGLWQFIPALAREYDLKMNWWYDGRRDILAATEAATRHLQSLGKQFDGDWLLALAAYNSGHNRIARQVKKLKQQGKPVDFRHLKLPRETRGYIPKMVGLACLYKHPQRYGFQPVEVPLEPLVETVDTGGQMDLALAAELAGMNMDELYHYNPAWNQWATDPDGPYQLLLPRKAAEQFREKLAQLPADQRVTWKRIRIQPGDSLIRLARRHHVTPQLLKEVNHLKGHLIRAGDHLMVPQSHHALSQYNQTQAQRLARLQQKAVTPQSLYHKVAAGESFWSISRHYGVSVRALARWNGMAPGDVLRVGQKLVIRQPKKGFSTARTSRSRQQQIVYTVRRGESLWSISRKFAVDVAAIRKWNGLKRDLLKPGQKLRLQVDVTRQAG